MKSLSLSSRQLPAYRLFLADQSQNILGAPVKYISRHVHTIISIWFISRFREQFSTKIQAKNCNVNPSKNKQFTRKVIKKNLVRVGMVKFRVLVLFPPTHAGFRMLERSYIYSWRYFSVNSPLGLGVKLPHLTCHNKRTST